ncbi:L-sorbosone dehydrogenase [Lysobacter dokdonensis DS-58]|uniref:L-sorbosone dehydrogenase n=1 Tax=Lysobacter dokdonensis DS-58 TaxID=1300345 RepID=A0A0A2WE55_9GAMM|nr:YbhB/YbcL family Raf kinase inhibitor-like protein [Lysobacter dokdonensis]KGQ18491.1 L-sorbosone dehydrogenase [Lysobacter dokdonensis DS-58]
MFRRNALTLACLAAWAGAAVAQDKPANVDVQTSVTKPARAQATSDNIAKLRVPSGYTVGVFAKDLGNARILAVAPDGRVYVSRRDEGDVVMLQDADNDGRADGTPVEVLHRAGAHGITIHDGKLYVATVKEVFVGDLKPDGGVGELKMLAGDLPDGGQHPNRTLAFGPDGMLYVSIGSTCNACNESNPEHATIVRMSPDGKTRTVFAGGLRNTIGFGWEPSTGELWGVDHGIDDLGDDVQKEELNKLAKGKKYGWPYVYGKNEINVQGAPPPGGITREEWAKSSEPMVMGYTAHAAPMQMAFDGQGDAFVAMHGSWNRRKPSGYEVVRVDFENGAPTKIEPFMTGFLTDGGKAYFGRPVGIAMAKDGALLVGDDVNGVLYRVSANGKAMGQAKTPPAGPMEAQAKMGVGVPIAMQRDETKTSGALKVTSPTIKPNAPIPKKHSEYYDGVSPALSWTAAAGAKSYAIIMEDPDAKPITPFVHWVAWNIPGNVTQLPEGLHESLKLPDPPGLMQGKTSRGNAGYLGPRPPAEDPAHHYHFQVLALDTTLDLPIGADRDQLLKAAQGHVIAKGELIGTYDQDQKPMK